MGVNDIFLQFFVDMLTIGSESVDFRGSESRILSTAYLSNLSLLTYEIYNNFLLYQLLIY